MIKAITFDLDGVYFINGKSNFIKNLSGLGVPEGEVRRVFFKSDEMNQLYKCGKMTDEEYWKWALNEWKLDITVEEITNLLISGYEENKEVVNVVKKARESGYKTLICSNNFPARINGLNKRFGFLNNFDAKAISCEVGQRKPSKEIFQELVRQSEVEANEIVFSDDDEKNVLSAKSVGINAFLYENFEGFLSKLKELGVKI